MWEFAPAWSNPKMTKNQVKRYIREMEEKRQKAKEELEKAQKSWELKKQKDELKKIEENLEDLF